MDIITRSIKIKGSINPTVAILAAFCSEESTIEQKWDSIRMIRDELLEQTDWIIVKNQELGTSVPQNYLDYRQLLRDIPQTYQNPEDVIFPEL